MLIVGPVARLIELGLKAGRPPENGRVYTRVKISGSSKKASKIKGFRANGFEEYGLKAARRAPQFSKR